MTDARDFSVILPLPPSLNNLYVNVRGVGRKPSKRYKAWKTHAGWDLKLQGPWRIGGPVKIFIYVPLNMPGDVDNRAKAIPDLLVAHDRIDDDKHVQSISVTRCAAVLARKCRVEVRPA